MTRKIENNVHRTPETVAESEEGISTENEKVKSAMALELMEAGMSIRTVARLLNLSDMEQCMLKDD